MKPTSCKVEAEMLDSQRIPRATCKNFICLYNSVEIACLSALLTRKQTSSVLQIERFCFVASFGEISELQDYPKISGSLN